MRRKFLLTVSICALLCALTACGGMLEKLVPQPPPAETPPPQAEAPAGDPVISGPVRGEEPSIPPAGGPGAPAAYAGILEELYQSCRDPERFRYEDGPAFALYDADRDGVEELIVRDATGELGRWARIYGCLDGAGEAYLELETYPDLCLYDNGVVEAAWSRSQGVAGDKLWPYDLYRYDGNAYARIAGVDGWDRSITEVYAGEAFPAEADQDGDGYVYYIITEEGGYAPVDGEAVDNGAYEAWRSSQLGGALPCGPSFLPLVREYIGALGR